MQSALRPVLLFVLASALLGAGCNFRASDRLSEVQVQLDLPFVGTVNTTYEISYNDDGTLDEVELRNNGNDLIRRVTYTWDGEMLTEMDIKEGSDSWTVDVEYEDGRPVRMEGTEPGGRDVELEVEYEGNDINRPSEIRTRSKGSAFTDITETTYQYNDRGLVEEEDKLTRTEDNTGTIASESETDFDVSYDDDGFVEKIDRTIRSGNNTNEDRARYRYDQGRLDEVEDFDSDEFSIRYDDEGRIDSVNGRDTNVDVEYKYDDGSTRGFNHTPIGVEHSGLFDVRGNSHGLVDVRALFVQVLAVE